MADWWHNMKGKYRAGARMANRTHTDAATTASALGCAAGT